MFPIAPSLSIASMSRRPRNRVSTEGGIYHHLAGKKPFLVRAQLVPSLMALGLGANFVPEAPPQFFCRPASLPAICPTLSNFPLYFAIHSFGTVGRVGPPERSTQRTFVGVSDFSACTHLMAYRHVRHK